LSLNGQYVGKRRTFVLSLRNAADELTHRSGRNAAGKAIERAPAGVTQLQLAQDTGELLYEWLIRIGGTLDYLAQRAGEIEARAHAHRRELYRVWKCAIDASASCACNTQNANPGR
jgi:hypothetical protein